MDNLLSLHWQPFVQTLGWTILHSIWQISLMALLLKVILAFSVKKSVYFRYWVSIIALFIATAWSFYTFQQEWSAITLVNINVSDLDLDLATNTDASMSGGFIGETSQKNWIYLTTLLEPLLPFLALLWFLGVAFFASRILMGFAQLHQYSRKGIESIPLHWQEKVVQLCQAYGIRRKVIMQLSHNVKAPITYRMFRPIILFPVSLFTGLNDAQIEVLLLHELAHIKRYDYVFNLLQSFVEVLFFYHPLVWWMSEKVRQERELCCDDWVMQIRHQPMLYAQTLTQIQAQHYSFKTKLAMSANGNKGVFTQRIYRLFGKQESESKLRKSAFGLLLLLFSVMTMAFYPAKHRTDKAFDVVQNEIIQDTIPSFKIRAKGTTSNKKPGVYIIDGKSIELTGSMDLEQILKDQQIGMEDIQTIDVEKGTVDLIKKYGAKAQDGVVTIWTSKAIPNKVAKKVIEKIGDTKSTTTQKVGFPIEVTSYKAVNQEKPTTEFFIEKKINNKLHENQALNTKVVEGFSIEVTDYKDNKKEATSVMDLVVEKKLENKLHEGQVPNKVVEGFPFQITGYQNNKKEATPVVDFVIGKKLEDKLQEEQATNNKVVEGFPVYIGKDQPKVVEGFQIHSKDTDVDVEEDFQFNIERNETKDVEENINYTKSLETESVDFLSQKTIDYQQDYRQEDEKTITDLNPDKHKIMEKVHVGRGLFWNRLKYNKDGTKRELPLIIVNGEKVKRQPYDPNDPDNIDPSDITLMKGWPAKNIPGYKSGQDIYGEEGKYGAWEITTKEKNKKNTFQIRAKQAEKGAPLYIIDGKPTSHESFLNNKLDPENIKDITVLKGTQATILYGADGKNGVIIITTKSKEAQHNKVKDTKKTATVKIKDLHEKITASEDKAPITEESNKVKPSITELKLDKVSTASLSLFPNPTDAEANISLDITKSATYRLEVYNTQGKLITTLANQAFEKGKYSFQWNTTGQTSGTYLIVLSNDKPIISKRLIVK